MESSISSAVRRLSLLVPVYRQRHARRYQVFIKELSAAVDRLGLQFETVGDTPIVSLRHEGLIFAGFCSDAAHEHLYRTLSQQLPSKISAASFRLARDVLTRWCYPHLRPDLRPKGAAEQLRGFHGQHRDAIDDLQNADAIARLHRAFKPKPDDIVLDGGSFVGIGAIQMSRNLPDGCVVAIEANEACASLLCRNVETNSIDNVQPVHAALWSDTGDKDLHTDGAQANSLVSEVLSGSALEKSQTITIDALVRHHGLPKVDMVGLTINGAEIEALEGATNVLSHMRPRIRLAGWYRRGESRIADLAKPFLENLGYEVFVGSRGNLLALPQEFTR